MAHELEKDALNIGHSVAIGVAGSAPMFSLAATLSTLIGAVGILAPASLLYCGLMMTGIVLAYRYLNERDPNAGAAYAWGSDMLGRIPGFLAGWALLVASVLFMVSATLPAGTATLTLLYPSLADSQTAIILCGMIWLVLVTWSVVKGASLAGGLLTAMTIIEMGIMAAMAIGGLMKFGGAPLHELGWHDLSLFSFTPSNFAGGAVIALFFFWGWDVSLNLSEETKNPGTAPGIGAVAAIFALIVLFGGFTAIALLVLDDNEIQQSVTGILFAMAEKIFPRPWSYMAILAIILSTICTLQTQMLQFSRTMFAKSRDGALNPRWANLHDSWRTPHAATFLICGLGLILLAASLASEGIAQVMKDSINVIGVLAAYYYGIAGLACAISYRDALRQSAGAAIAKVIWPVLSALVLFWAGFQTLLETDFATDATALGGMALAIVPLVRFRPSARNGQSQLEEGRGA